MKLNTKTMKKRILKLGLLLPALAMMFVVQSCGEKEIETNDGWIQLEFDPFAKRSNGLPDGKGWMLGDRVCGDYPVLCLDNNVKDYVQGQEKDWDHANIRYKVTVWPDGRIGDPAALNDDGKVIFNSEINGVIQGTGDLSCSKSIKFPKEGYFRVDVQYTTEALPLSSSYRFDREDAATVPTGTDGCRSDYEVSHLLKSWDTFHVNEVANGRLNFHLNDAAYLWVNQSPRKLD